MFVYYIGKGEQKFVFLEVDSMKTTKRQRAKQRRAFMRGFILVMIVVSTLVSVTAFSDNRGEKYAGYDEVYVKPGDTLWSIAESHYDKNTDVREAIYAITECNELDDGMIYVGQKILLPQW